MHESDEKQLFYTINASLLLCSYDYSMMHLEIVDVFIENRSNEYKYNEYKYNDTSSFS